MRNHGEPRNYDFTLESGKLPASTRAGWGAVRDFFREARRIQAEARKSRDAVMRNADLTDEARLRKVAETSEAAAKAANEAYTRLRERVVSKAQELRAEAHTPPKREKPGNLAEQLLDEVATRLARSEVVQAVDQAIEAAEKGNSAALHQVYHALIESGDQRALELFERIAPARAQRLAGMMGKALATDLREEMETTAEERLSDDAKLLLDHADALAGTLELAEATTAELGHEPALYGSKPMPSLLGAEAGYGAELAGLGE